MTTGSSTAESHAAGRGPWWWVPTLYFAEGVPYVVVMTVAVAMFKRLGVGNAQIALYTSWLYLPWAIKPLWSPLVQRMGTRRSWIVVMQFFVAAGLASAALAIPLISFLRWSLVALAATAIVSATHDVAADGFYLLALSPHQQAWFVGIRSTAYRMAMIAGQGLLVMLAGASSHRLVCRRQKSWCERPTGRRRMRHLHQMPIDRSRIPMLNSCCPSFVSMKSA